MIKSKFKVGDSVYSNYFGEGTVTSIDENPLFSYPVHVRWTKKKQPFQRGEAIFTPEGNFIVGIISQWDIVPLREKQEAPEYKLKDKGVEDNMGEELRVGDWVWLNPNEKGTIIFIYPNKETCIVDSELDGEVETVMAGLTKVEYSPINPSHYRMKGIPEAIDIMKHLMTQEQFKGFLWGNIIKYAYRYGRKGDEHDTAGKIEWYANRLKEVCAEEKKEQERE